MNSVFRRFSIQPMTGFFRLLTHRRSAHRKFFPDPCFKMEILPKCFSWVTLCSKGLNFMHLESALTALANNFISTSSKNAASAKDLELLYYEASRDYNLG